MIDNWPDPYPDELFYSIWTRYSGRVQHLRRCSAVAELFSAEHAIQECKLGMPVYGLLWQNGCPASNKKQQTRRGNQ